MCSLYSIYNHSNILIFIWDNWELWLYSICYIESYWFLIVLPTLVDLYIQRPYLGFNFLKFPNCIKYNLSLYMCGIVDN